MKNSKVLNSVMNEISKFSRIYPDSCFDKIDEWQFIQTNKEADTLLLHLYYIDADVNAKPTHHNLKYTRKALSSLPAGNFETMSNISYFEMAAILANKFNVDFVSLSIDIE